jgi:hypothetical protein
MDFNQYRTETRIKEKTRKITKLDGIKYKKREALTMTEDAKEDIRRKICKEM